MNGPAHYQTLEYQRVCELFRGFADQRSQRLRVLDYGCGQGKYLSGFAALGIDATGVDSNAAYVETVRNKGHVAFTAEEFPYGTAVPFDVIFLSHLIEHLPPESLVELIPTLCRLLRPNGHLVVVSPVPGERFYHDFTHVRPYLPQSIRHAFGQTGAPISLGERRLLELVDVYFFKDPIRTRMWRSFYMKTGPAAWLTRRWNTVLEWLWRVSGGRVGAVASWLGVYRLDSAKTPDA